MTADIQDKVSFLPKLLLGSNDFIFWINNKLYLNFIVVFITQHCLLIVWAAEFLKGGWDFWKIIEGGEGAQDFFVKVGGGGGTGGEENTIFSLAMVCSNNALYSASNSFGYQRFLLFRIKSQPDVAYKGFFFYKKSM